jgi:DNA-binding NtrC family response regulator
MQNYRHPLIFVVEDNPVYNDLITGVLKARQFKNVRSFSNTDECFKNITQNPDIIVLNYAYSDFTGLDLMKKVHETRPDVIFIFLSGQNNVEVAVKIMRHGAFDYIVKNDKAPDNLINAIQIAVKGEKRQTTQKSLRKGAILFFILVLVLIILIFSLSLFSDDFKLF